MTSRFARSGNSGPTQAGMCETHVSQASADGFDGWNDRDQKLGDNDDFRFGTFAFSGGGQIAFGK